MKKLNKLKKIGILGGTFDPIHLGHIHCARQVLELAKLDHIEFMPAYIPPHRGAPEASAPDRLAMLQLAIQEEARFSINLDEIHRSDVSYTIDSLIARKHRHNNSELIFLILGQDAFYQFHTWKDWQHITDYCQLIILNRPGFPNLDLSTDLSGYAAPLAKWIPHQPISWLNIPACPISATAIREAIKKGRVLEELSHSALDPRVAQYIQEKALYR